MIQKIKKSTLISKIKGYDIPIKAKIQETAGLIITEK
jgi:hypothetical protein